jgi:diguanylate cyclase (GGDEF)-like protein/PAS domain S-box-containing protein
MKPEVDVIVICDVDGTITGWNAGAAGLLGYPATAMEGRPISQIIPKDLVSAHEELRRRVVTAGEFVSLKTRRLACDGTEVSLSMVAFPVRNTAHAVVGLCEFGRLRGKVRSRAARWRGRLTHKLASSMVPSEIRRLCPALDSPGTATLRRVMDSMFAYVGLFSLEGTVLEINKAPLEAAGLQPSDVIGRPAWDTYWWSYSEEARQEIRQAIAAAAGGKTVHRELAGRMKGGAMAIVDNLFCPLRDARGNILAVVCNGVDVTGQREAQVSLSQTKRELLMLSVCNQALVRSGDEADLLDAVCRLIVEVGGYTFAWVGFAENDPARTVRPVAAAGVGIEFLQSLGIVWDTSPKGCGPTGRAIRERREAVCEDRDADPAFLPWCESTRFLDFSASAALPLILGRTKIGVLNIYSPRKEAFRAQELQLLLELAEDLSYGITSLRSQLEHERAESKLRLFRRLLDRTNDLIYVADPRTGTLLDANESAGSKLGVSRAELLKMNVADFSLIAPARSPDAAADSAYIAEAYFRARDGSQFPVEASLSYVHEGTHPYLIAVARDITERKRQEERITHLSRILRMQSSINTAVLRIRSSDDLLNEACRVATELGGYDRAMLWVVDPDSRHARLQFKSGVVTEIPAITTLDLSDGTEPDTNLVSRTLRTGELAHTHDLTQSELPIITRQKLIELGMRSVVALPLLVEGRPFGVLTLDSRHPNRISDEEQLLLKEVRSTLEFALEYIEHKGATERLLYFDPLTGLAKRALFCRRLGTLLQNQDELLTPLMIAAFDVRSLTEVNDRFGRRIGDLVLQTVAERLRLTLGRDECIGYLGAGSFVLAAHGNGTNQSDINALLECLVSDKPFEVEGHPLRISCSWGIARCGGPSRTADSLVQNAEAALKCAKETGEQYMYFEPQMQSEITARFELQERLRTAVDQQQFALHYQPQVNLNSGQVECVEALLRWNDPQKGLVMPGYFLSALESSGMIVKVGTWVLERAVQDCRRWRSTHLGPVRVAVNVSAVQLHRPSFVHDTLRIVAGLESQGYGLDIEITETTLLQDLDAVSMKLGELRAAGMRVALDDFGTGYSSLALLAKLPVDLLKIDRSFIMGLPTQSASVALVSNITRLANAFGLLTVAEGVETAEQLEMLREFGCSLFQGSLCSMGIPVDEFELLLARGATDGVSPRAQADSVCHPQAGF